MQDKAQELLNYTHNKYELVLTVAETDFVWEEQVVYHQLNKSESVAWGLFTLSQTRLSHGFPSVRKTFR